MTWPRSHRHRPDSEPVLLPACSSSWPCFSPALRDVSQIYARAQVLHPVRLAYAMEGKLRQGGNKVKPKPVLPKKTATFQEQACLTPWTRSP